MRSSSAVVFSASNYRQHDPSEIPGGVCRLDNIPVRAFAKIRTHLEHISHCADCCRRRASGTESLDPNDGSPSVFGDGRSGHLGLGERLHVSNCASVVGYGNLRGLRLVLCVLL